MTEAKRNREAFIVERREQGITYELIGRELGISKERVRQLYTKATRKPEPVVEPIESRITVDTLLEDVPFGRTLYRLPSNRRFKTVGDLLTLSNKELLHLGVDIQRSFEHFFGHLGFKRVYSRSEVYRMAEKVAQDGLELAANAWLTGDDGPGGAQVLGDAIRELQAVRMSRKG